MYSRGSTGMAKHLLIFVGVFCLIFVGALTSIANAAEYGIPRELTVLSWNIRHGRGLDGVVNLDRIAKEILRAGVDIAILNEVDNNWGPRSGYANQPELLGRLTGLNVAYFASLERLGLNGYRQYGNVILSKYPIVIQGGFTLPKSFGTESRTVNRVVVDLGGEHITVYGTHLTIVRKDTLKQITEINEMIAKEVYPVILAGDLNVVSPSPEIRELVERGKLVDSFSLANPGKPGFTFPASNASERVDYIFLQEPLAAYLVSASVLETRASDHHAILVKLKVPQTEQS